VKKRSIILTMAKKKKVKKIIFKKGFPSKLSAFLGICLFGTLISLIAFLSLIIYYSKDLPRPEKFTESRISQPTKIYDRKGETLLYSIFGEEKREIISLKEMPDYLKNAVITAEDRKFYQHFGIDPKGIVRAILVNLKIKRPAQGGSTIPQQLIRSAFLSPEKTIERKMREIILSLELDRRYPKDQILEWYLNQVPFGSNAYGVEAAAQTFFGKNTKDLTLAEAATLASLIQMPSYLSPYGEHQDELLERKDYVLEQMEKENYLDQEECEKAKQEELNFAKPAAPIIAPHFIIHVRKYLIEKYGEEYLKRKGFKVITSLDLELQKSAEEIVSQGAERNQNFKSFNASLVAIDPKTGEVLALVGSRSFFDESYPEGCSPGRNCLFEPEFNVATLGMRQPGSAFKPFVYATAFEKGHTDKEIVIDEETNFGVWGGKEYIPQNYDGFFRGPVTLRQALAQSLNVPSVKVLVNLAGIKESLEMAKRLGITTLKDVSHYGPALVLGGGEVTLLEMTSAYGAFATNGLYNKPITILKIEDNEGKTIERNQANPKRALSSKTAETINDILSDNQARTPMFGPNSALYINDNVSGKTGTTQFFNDAWTIGYNHEIVVGVWTGNNDNSSSREEPGVVLAGPIWKNFMIEAIQP